MTKPLVGLGDRKADVLRVLLALALVATGLSIATGTSHASSARCSTVVQHDAFLDDNRTVSRVAENGTGVSVVRNTRVTVEDVSLFVRLTADNPNGYCVQYIVRLDKKVVEPSELGEVDSLDGSTTATWRAKAGFGQNNETHTEIIFTVPPGSTVTFAPSKVRVRQLKWVADAKTAGSGIFDRVRSYVDDEPALEERQYTITPDGASSVTVSLVNQETGERVEEWQAMYRVDDGDWRPIKTDAEDPVYYSIANEGDALKFHFNDQDGEVRLTANPSAVDKAKHQYRSYMAGFDFFDGLFDDGNDAGEDDGLLP